MLPIALLAASTAAQSQSRKEIYELQERCGKSAAEAFEKDFPKADRNGLEFFENSYNVRLNKCIMLENSTMVTRDQGKTGSMKILMLVDVHGNKVLGSFTGMNCEVQEAKCRNEQEFRALIKPFMEEQPAR
jgi:hypothetical protein